MDFTSSQGPLRAVDGVSFEVHTGENVALVGESGCGKTVTSLAVLGLLPSRTSTVGGTVDFDGVRISDLPPRKLRKIRGAGISMVFQEPVASLNPVFTIGQQIAGVIRAHDATVSRAEARRRSVELLEAVGVADAHRRIHEHPHQWSGGMCQRAVIAMAIANRPRVVIADEPTTALDVTVQAQVLEVLRAAQRETGAATLLITHDLAVVAEMADRVLVMYAGRIVEEQEVGALFRRPRHPYTAGLLGSVPTLSGGPLRAIAGLPPQLHRVPSGCSFHPRCPVTVDHERCGTVRPELRDGDDGAPVACHFPGEHQQRDRPVVTEPVAHAGSGSADEPTGTETPVLSVEDLEVRFPIRADTLRRGRRHLRAVDGVDLRVSAGETLALVGESGCGKTTTAMAIMRLIEPSHGRVVLRELDLTGVAGKSLREVRRGIQMVFQDPHASLDPKFRVGDSVAEPLRIHGVRGTALRTRVAALLEMVGLHESHATRLPHELSGGQLQRVGIARALALDPQLLVLDEPVSALDVSVQAQVLNLLTQLQRDLGVAYLFISHDLSVVRHVAHRVAVMYRGRIVETAPVDELYDDPKHHYTRSLLDAVPRIDPTARGRVRTQPIGEVPTAASPSQGCPFASRCPSAQERCAHERPVLDGAEAALAGTGHRDAGHAVACHFPLSRRDD